MKGTDISVQSKNADLLLIVPLQTESQSRVTSALPAERVRKKR
jgi:hypothetical protein